MKEAAGGWRRLHNEKLQNLYASPNTVGVIKSGRMRGTGQITRMGEKKIQKKISVGNHERRGPLESPRLTRGDNIIMDLREIGSEGWMYLPQKRD
jgi:hypothetical protein